MTFEELNVKPEIIKVLTEDGIVNPTTIQEKTIPLAHEGKDIIGISRTGSGKTASFGIPMIEKVTKDRGVQGLVLAPTRELANQISNEMRKWGKYLNIKVATVFGGVGFEPQVEAIATSEIVVGTPGRLLDHLSRNTLTLSKLKCIVLDEADKMVEMGFIEDIERIMSLANPESQILLFGATISKEVDYLKDKYMDDVVVAEAELQVKKDLLKQYYYNCQVNEKFSLLAHLLKKEETGRVIIFCSKISTVELINRNLRNNGFKSEMIHGKLSQNKRLTTIDRFNKGKTDIMVASAVAARGLDIKDVTHVFNYDLSQDAQEYVHRIGRTARAGESGKAITLLATPDYDAFYAVLDRYRMDVEELPKESFPRLRFEIPQRRVPFRTSNFNHNSSGFRGEQYRGRSNFQNRNDSGRENYRSTNRPSFSRSNPNRSFSRPRS